MAALACCGALAGNPASAQDFSIPAGTPAIPLRNASGMRLEFYILESSGWARRALDPRAEAELPYKETFLAISTAKNAQDVAAFSAPTLRPDAMAMGTEATTTSGPFFVRRAVSGDRLELCWSGPRRNWVVAKIGEGLCGPS